MERLAVTGAGGVRLAARRAGPEGAPSVLFLHGWSQHSMCWAKQMRGPLAERLRMGAIDLRGHGESDKPEDPAAYRSSELWAEDIRAAIAGLGLERPVLVGWSMGGWVAADYLRVHGDAEIAGLVLIGSSPRVGAMADPAVLARRRAEVRAEGAYEADQEVQIAALLAFVKAMTAAPLSKREMAMAVAWAMPTPPGVRAACRLRDEDWRAALGRVSVPALVIQGAAERVCLPPVYEEMLATIPGAEGRVYPRSGHMAFWEEAERFDADLAGLVARAAREAA